MAKDTDLKAALTRVIESTPFDFGHREGFAEGMAEIEALCVSGAFAYSDEFEEGLGELRDQAEEWKDVANLVDDYKEEQDGGSEEDLTGYVARHLEEHVGEIQGLIDALPWGAMYALTADDAEANTNPYDALCVDGMLYAAAKAQGATHAEAVEQVVDARAGLIPRQALAAKPAPLAGVWIPCAEGCAGWFIDEALRAVNRCDDCARFASDDEAEAYVNGPLRLADGQASAPPVIPPQVIPPQKLDRIVGHAEGPIKAGDVVTVHTYDATSDTFNEEAREGAERAPDPLAWLVSFFDQGALTNEWYIEARNVYGAITKLQADELEYSEVFQANEDLRNFLDNAKPGDTFSPGWGVLFVARLAMGDEVTSEVMDWDQP